MVNSIKECKLKKLIIIFCCTDNTTKTSALVFMEAYITVYIRQQWSSVCVVMLMKQSITFHRTGL